MISQDLRASTILFEDFEDITILYSADDTEASDGVRGYFGRIGGTGGLSHTSGGYTSPPSGTGYFAAEDVDKTSSGAPKITDDEGTIRFQNINIAGMTDIQFSAYFAADDDGGVNWDSTDYLHVTYSIDAGAEQNLIWYEESIVSTTASIDADFNGVGDGVTTITSTFNQQTISIAGTGDSLELIFRMRTDSFSEGMGFDDVTITAVPEPHEYAFAATLLLIGFTAWRRSSQSAPQCN